MENIRSLVNAASAHKVFAGSDPFCTYSTVLEDLYHCFFESVLCFLLLGVGGGSACTVGNLILKYSLSLKPLLDRWLILLV